LGGHAYLARFTWYPASRRVAFVGHSVLFQGLVVAEDGNLDAVEIWHGEGGRWRMEVESEKRYCRRVPLRVVATLFDLCRMRQRVLRHVGIAGVHGFYFFQTLEKFRQTGAGGDERRAGSTVFSPFIEGGVGT